MATNDSMKELKKILDKRSKEEKTDPWYVSWSDRTENFIEKMPTGSLLMDYVLGDGGSPRGRLSEYYGKPGSGKTTAACIIAAAYQKRGIPVLYIDAENKFDPDFILNTTGFNVWDEDTVLFSQEENAAHVYEMIETCALRGFGLAIVDSSSAVYTDAQFEAQYGEAQMAQLARMHSESIRKIKGICNRHKCEIIFISQMRVKSNGYTMYEDSSAANAIKFYSSIRNQFKAIEFIKDKDDQVIGLKSQMENKKNSVGMPFRSADITIYINKGIDAFTETVELAVAHGVINKKGGWFEYSSFDNEKPIQGMANVIEWFRNHMDAYTTLQKETETAMKESKNKKNLKDTISVDTETGEILDDAVVVEDMETGERVTRGQRGKKK